MTKKLLWTLFVQLYVLITFNVIGQERIIYLKGSAPFDLFSSNLDGSNEILITTGVANGSRCAVKSGKIYYFSGSSIHRINLDGTGHTIIPNTNDAIGEVAISPAGDKLVYAGGSYNYQMIIMDTNGMNKTIWNNGAPNSIHQTGPSWNTTGTIFFVQSNYGNAYTQKIYSKPDNDPAAAPVLLTPSFAHEPNSGGPDNLVIFNDLSGNLITMNPDGSNPVTLSTAGGGNYAKGAWRLSDSTFYYMHSNNIWKIKYNNTGNSQITTAGGIERVIGFGVLNPVFNITASANPVCQGNPVTFTASGTGNFSSGSLQWYVNGVAVQTGNITNGLVAWYPFTGNANDLSGFGHHGTVSGATLANDRFGNANKAYAFDGINDFIKINPSPVLDIKHSLTLSAWFQADPSNLNGQTQITWRGDPQGNYDPYSLCFTNSGYLSFRRDVGSGSTVNQITSPASAINLNLWHHIAGTYDSASGEMKLYLDGILKTQQTLAGTANYPTSTFWNMIGGVDNGYGQNFKGSLDDVRIYRRALSASEILQLNQNFDTTITYIPQNGDTVYCVYTSAGTPTVTDTSNFIIMQVNSLPADIGESTGMASLQNGLVAYYPFNGNANDESGNGNHGTVIGCQTFPDRLGNNNGSYFFNGTDNLIRAENSASLNIQNSISLSAWFKTDDPDINHSDNESSMIVAKHKTNNSRSYSVFLADQTFWGDSIGLQLFAADNSYYPTTTHSNYWDNSWHSINTTYDYSTGLSKIYIDGQLRRSSSNGQISLMQTTVPLTIGCYLASQSTQYRGFYHGLLDDIRIYNRALTLEEVQCLSSGSCNVLSIELSSASICLGANTSLSLFNAQPSIQYQLLKNGINFGPPQTGNGDTLTFPISGLTATSNFTIHALNPATGCNRMLDTTMVVTVVTFVTATSPDTSVCSGGNVVLQAFGGNNYQWSNGMTGPSITVTPLATTTYYVTVSNAEGCSGVDSVKVTVYPMAAPVISGSNAMCVNSGYYYYSTDPGMNNYQWSASPGATIIWGNGTPDLIVTWDQPGAQWVSVNYTNSSGCTALAPTQFNVNVNPLPGVAGTITGPATVCAGSTGVGYSTTLISSAVTYVWSLPPGATIASGAGTNAITVDFSSIAQPGNITVYGNNLCGNGSLSAPLTISVGALPGLAGIPVGLDDVCEGDTGIVFYIPPVFNAASYVWDIQGGGEITAGNGTNSIRAKFPTAPADCQITVYGTNACGQGTISPVKAVTVHPTPETPAITQNGDILMSSAPAGNQWFLNSAIIPNATQQTYAPIVTGQYSVQVTLEGCPSEWSDQYYYIMTGIAAPSGWQATLWPNPNKGSFSVYLKGIPGEQVSITVINSLGVRMHEQRFALSSSEGEMQIDMRAAAPGVYMVMIEAGRVTRGLKMVVE